MKEQQWNLRCIKGIGDLWKSWYTNVPSGPFWFDELFFLSSSQIKLETPEFILGDINKLCKGSNGNLETAHSLSFKTIVDLFLLVV